MNDKSGFLKLKNKIKKADLKALRDILEVLRAKQDEPPRLMGKTKIQEPKRVMIRKMILDIKRRIRLKLKQNRD